MATMLWNPLPLAPWMPRKWDDRLELRPLPDEVKPPPIESLRGATGMTRDAIQRRPTDRASLATQYVGLSAAYIHAGMYEEAMEVVALAHEQFATYNALFSGASAVFASRHAAAFYNAAVAYRARNMAKDALDMLAHSVTLQGQSGSRRAPTVTDVVVAGATRRLQGQLSGRPWMLRHDDPAVHELASHRPSLVRAADAGDAAAAEALAVLAKVFGCLDEAIAWYAMAADLGDPTAGAEAEKLIANWSVGSP